MRESAAPGDTQYLLRHLDHTTFRFRPNSKEPVPSGELEREVVACLRRQPGQTVNDLRVAIPRLGQMSYNDARAFIVSMVARKVLSLDGQAALEEVDPRYERVESCDVCGDASTKHKVVFWKYNTPVVRCSTCGLLYANPRWKAEHLFGRYTEEYWGQYEDAMQQTARDAMATVNQARWNHYLSTLEPARRTGVRLLDIGCATGEFLAAAKERGWEVYGVETSPIAAARAERAAGAKVHIGTLDTAPYPDAWFDAITLWHVIEHVQSPGTYVEQISRLLRPNGIFSLATPNIRSIDYKLLGRSWRVVGPNDHIYYFAPRTMERLLKRFGLAIHAIYTTGTSLETWQRWLKYPALKPLAPWLHKAAQPLVSRFMLGDELFAVARRVP